MKARPSPDVRSSWSLSLGYGRRRPRLLLAYLLPFVLIVAALAYGIFKELRRGKAVFDQIASRLSAYTSILRSPGSTDQYPEVVARGTIGLDALPADRNRRTAAEAARDSGGPVVTAAAEQGRLQVFSPRYRTKDIPRSLLERRRLAAGWTYLTFLPEELIRAASRAGSTRVEMELYDVPSSSLLATTAAKRSSSEGGSIDLRFQRKLHPLGRPWLLRQTRRNRLRAVLLHPETLIWLAIIILPVIFLSRRSLSRRSFELGPTMLDDLVDVIEVVDLDGCVVYTSPSIAKNFRYAPEDVLNREFLEFVHPDDAASVGEAFERIKSSDAGEVIKEFRRRDSGGAWHHVEGTGRRITVQGRVIAILITTHDVSSVVSAQNELWVSEERFWRLFDSIKDYAIAIVDLAGNISSWNAAAERMTGYSAVEIIGMPISILYPEDGSPDDDIKPPAEGQSVEIEAWRARKDGTRFLAQVVRSPITDRQGRVTGFSSIMRDITERRMIEAQVSQAQRLDSLGKLAGGIAHDFNNMLMVIFSRAEVLSRGGHTLEQQRRYIEDIKTAASKSSDLTQQLLAAARKQVLQPEVVDLNTVVSSTMRLLRASIGEDIRMRIELQPALWPIFADPGKLHQVLMNLALNARDAMPDGGALTIETRNVHAEASYVHRHPQLPGGDHVLLVVTDSGQGIPPEDQQRIYDPFFSTKSTGTGLGLSVVRGIVEQTGGQIWLYSEVGVGTAFRIFFPRHREAASLSDAITQPDLPGEHGTETILLVEDEDLLRTIIRETLEEHGYHVLEAASPEQAIKMNRTHKERIDLLLTDVVMPGMNGRALAGELTTVRPDLRVVFMSGYTDNVLSHHGVLDEGEWFVEKPAPTAVLLRVVREALDADGS